MSRSSRSTICSFADDFGATTWISVMLTFYEGGGTNPVSFLGGQYLIGSAHSCHGCERWRSGEYDVPPIVD